MHEVSWRLRGVNLGYRDYVVVDQSFTPPPTDLLVGPGGPLPFAFARKETFPTCLKVTATSRNGVIMGVRHRKLPIEAVQFHPEPVLAGEAGHGLRLMENAVKLAKAVRPGAR